MKTLIQGVAVGAGLIALNVACELIRIPESIGNLVIIGLFVVAPIAGFIAVAKWVKNV